VATTLTPKTSNTNPVSKQTVEAATKPPSSHITVAVKKGSFEIFQQMLSPSETLRKSVNWDHFVSAMSEVGFQARSSGGSAVLFSPAADSKWDGMGKIVFHRPHPDSKIDYITLGSMGKRMRKWFDWSGDTFVLQEKPA